MNNKIILLLMFVSALIGLGTGIAIHKQDDYDDWQNKCLEAGGIQFNNQWVCYRRDSLVPILIKH